MRIVQVYTNKSPVNISKIFVSSCNVLVLDDFECNITPSNLQSISIEVLGRLNNKSKVQLQKNHPISTHLLVVDETAPIKAGKDHHSFTETRLIDLQVSSCNGTLKEQ